MVLKKVRYDDVDWIYLSRDRVRWRAVMNIVKNFWITFVGLSMLDGDNHLINLCTSIY
jgi:hypothetical protein